MGYHRSVKGCGYKRTNIRLQKNIIWREWTDMEFRKWASVDCRRRRYGTSMK